MIEEKELLKQCKKEINKANKICRTAPSINLVSKESKKLSQYTDSLDIEKLNENMTAETLQMEYNKCMRLKGKAEKIFVKMKAIQLSMASSIQRLRTICENMESFTEDIDRMEKTQNLSTMQTVLRQNLLSIQKWIEEEEKLIDSIKINVDLGVNLFKNYISKIVQIQRERLK